MKKLLLLFVSIIVASCSSDDSSLVNATDETSPLSVLEGDLLSYKNEASFIQEYSQLSKMSSTELQNWISKKGIQSLLNNSSDSLEIEKIVLSKPATIYSDALRAILNKDAKVKINGKNIWLNERNFYSLNEDNENKEIEDLKSVVNNLKVYGSVLNDLNTDDNKIKKLSNVSAVTIPVINGRSVTYSNASGNRYFLTLFIENIVFPNSQSSKAFIRTWEEYRSCSFWRCTWKNDNNSSRVILFNITTAFGCGWKKEFINGDSYSVRSAQTILLASREGYGYPCSSTEFIINGKITTYDYQNNNYVWVQNL